MAQDIDQFLEKAHAVHENKFTYSLSNYSNCKSYITIHCPEHGAFTQRVDHHLNGSSCKQCVDAARPGVFSHGLFAQRPDLKDLPSHFYFISIYDIVNNDTFLKVGITTRALHSRINSMLPKSKYIINVLYSFSNTLYSLYQLEQLILDQFKEAAYSPIEKFKGCTECLHYDYHDMILAKLAIFNDAQVSN